jgi:zinc transport system substrate-binding protein
MDRKAKVQEEQENFKIVTSFYPIYIMTKNITYGAEDVKLSNMADVNGGCLHDYTLIANDVKKVENADVFIQNGEGIENFIDKILETYSNVNIINSSEGIKELIQDNDEINGHIWTSLENYKKQLENIASKLSEYNSENAEIYNKNKEEYIKKLDELENKYKMELQNLSGENAVCLNEAFAYFGRDLNLDMIMVETDHEESTLSADALREVVNQVKEKNIKIIIIGEGDNTKNAETIEAETGAKTYILKTGLSGDYSLDSYLQDMEYNLEILKTISTN